MIEKALCNWFKRQSKHFAISNLDSHHIQPLTNISIKHKYKVNQNRIKNRLMHTKNDNNNNNSNHHRHHHHHPRMQLDNITKKFKSNNNNNNNNYNFIHESKKLNACTTTITNKCNNRHSSKQHLSSKSLIAHYPHFLRHKEEFFRKVNILMELKNKKEDFFQLGNIHFQTEYFRLEAEKWETYVVAATNKKQTSIEEQVEAMETIIEESHS